MADVRVLSEADIPEAMRLKAAANWNQTPQDWRNVMRLEPEGCFGIACDGHLVASTTAVCYGSRLAWIGMVLTHPEYRGRGYARALMEHALEWLRARGIEWIKLDATDMGRPLYARLGFEDECAIERWGRAPGAGPSLIELPRVDVEAVAEMDAAAFGTARAPMLRVLAEEESAAVPGGYAMGRPGSNAAYFGPCIAQSAGVARRLAEWYVARHGSESIYWDILPENTAAVEIAQGLGFTRLRQLVRMQMRCVGGSAPCTHHDGSTFAIAGFEYG